jgi:putative chitinase
MLITQNQLTRILPGNPYLKNWFDALNKILPDYDITTNQRCAAFLGQTYVESAGYTALHENLNYRAESLMRVWPRYFPDIDTARQYANKPEEIANRAYANRMGNGDEASGDGWRYCGKGLIQLTGKDNYQSFADSLQMSIDDVPAYLQTFEGAVQSAAWFWESNNLNQYSDAWDIETLSKKINGGDLGHDQRINYCNLARQILES